ncbi:MAG: hypothetical protein CYG60_08780 [Actinobacteria bacterium]|jgi:itaconyl-CoA hydratase|nr:MAG: hypothetical protein CYG60_08780 [Actinomycetota bacterium]
MSSTTTKEGRQGRSLDGFKVEDVCRNPLMQAITATDDSCFTLLIWNTAPVRFDTQYASQTGQGVTDVSRNILGSPGWSRSHGYQLESPRGTPLTPGRGTERASSL